MPKIVRQGILSFGVVYGLVLFLSPILYRPSEVGFLLLGLGNLFMVASYLGPLMFWRRGFGWFHPMVAVPLLSLIMLTIKKTPLLMFGMGSHDVLAMGPGELATLVGYESFLNGIAILCFYAGCIILPIRVTGLAYEGPQKPVTVPHLILMLGISAAALLYFVSFSGSFFQHVLNLSLNSSAKQFETDVDGYGQLIWPAYAGWLAVLLRLASPKTSLRDPIFWLCALLSLTALLLVTGKRSAVLYPMIIAGMVYALRAGHLHLKLVAVIGIGGLFLFGLLGSLRVQSVQTAMRGTAGIEGVEKSPIAWIQGAFEEMAYRSGSYATLYPILAMVPGEVPFHYGKTYAVVLVRPIPRLLWPGKPRGADVEAAMTFFGNNWGMPAGSVGESYWSLHIPGVVIVHLLAGLGLAALARYFLRNHKTSTFCIVIYASAVFMLRPSENSMTQFLYYFGMLVIVAALTGQIKFRTKGNRKGNRQVN